MSLRSSLFACVLASAALAGCGGGVTHVVERTPTAGQLASVEPAANAGQGSHPGGAPEPAASERSIYTPPEFPPNYRTLIAMELVVDYLAFGRGPPEITEVSSRVALFGASSNVCVQYPSTLSLSVDTPRGIPISAQRDPLTMKVSFTRPRNNTTNILLPQKCNGPTTPFVELERVAQKVKECQARGERRCVVNEQQGRKDTFVLPANLAILRP